MEKQDKSSGIIAVVGANGRMGRTVVERLSVTFPKFKIQKVNSRGHLKYSPKLKLVIDFASAVSSIASANFCITHKVPLIVGATGHTLSELSEIKRAGEFVPVVKSSNFALGIECLKQMTKLLSRLSVSDIYVLEKHHKSKQDAPSGTALELAGVIEHELKLSPKILYERGGEEIGTHSLDIYFGSEKLTLTHQSFSRVAFANGVLLASKVLLSGVQNGYYNFSEILQIYQNSN